MGNSTILEYHIGEFRGSFPDVPILPEILSGLRELDSDPFFVSLPIAEIGAISGNGLLYDEALIGMLEQQIKANRPGGIFGHLKDSERSTAFPIPDGMWVGAQRVGAQLWAKAWVKAGAGRDYLKALKAVGGKIATSIYGKGDYEATEREGVRRLRAFRLESLDFAPPERAALRGGATPSITAEFTEENPDMDKAQIIAELKVGEIPAALKAAIIADANGQSASNQQVTELQTKLAESDQRVAVLSATVAEYRATQFAATVDQKVAALTNWKVRDEAEKPKLEAFRRTVKSRIIAELGTEQTAAKLETVAEQVWTDLLPIAETMRTALAGPSALIHGRSQQQSGKRPALDTSPEGIAAARGAFQF